MEKTIAIISTPLGKGAIAIVRMSGEKAKSIALDIFSAKNLTAENISARYMYFGKLDIGDGAFEECLMVYFKAPFSYTGEDLIEFQVHGGVLLAQKVLEKCLSAGASLAEPGEFSKRAFLNGKITLDKAEAIVGEINAESEGELKNSLKITNGKLAEKILEEQEKLKYMLAELEVGMDYPDEVEELNLKLNIKGRLKKIADENEVLLKNSQNSTYLKNGINAEIEISFSNLSIFLTLSALFITIKCFLFSTSFKSFLSSSSRHSLPSKTNKIRSEVSILFKLFSIPMLSTRSFVFLIPAPITIESYSSIIYFLLNLNYFPKQNFEKIKSIISSFSVLPVIFPSVFQRSLTSIVKMSRERALFVKMSSICFCASFKI